MVDRETERTNGVVARACSPRLQEMLRKDVGEGDEASELLPTVQRLERWPAPAPTPEETARLVEALRPALPKRAARRAGWLRSAFCSLRTCWPWLLLRASGLPL